MWATAGQGSFSQPCQWTSTKPLEKEPMVQEPPLAYASQGLAVVLSPVFTLAHCFTYWLSHLHPVGHYGISQQSETNFPSKLSAAALEPLAHNWKVSNLLPCHCSQCSPGWLDISIWTRHQAGSPCPEQADYYYTAHIIHLPASFKTNQIAGYCLTLPAT